MIPCPWPLAALRCNRRIGDDKFSLFPFRCRSNVIQRRGWRCATGPRSRWRGPSRIESRCCWPMHDHQIGLEDFDKSRQQRRPLHRSSPCPAPNAPSQHPPTIASSWNSLASLPPTFGMEWKSGPLLHPSWASHHFCVWAVLLRRRISRRVPCVLYSREFQRVRITSASPGAAKTSAPLLTPKFMPGTAH